MAMNAQVSIDEYFRLPHTEREAEYVNGPIVERTMPDFLHSYIQLRLGQLLTLALQLYSGYLDLCILNYKTDPDSAPTTPPLLAVEIISKDDSYTDVLTKLRESPVGRPQHMAH